MKKLKELREEKGLSQVQLGKEIGIAPRTISGYETGTREPDFQTLKKLCKFFGVSSDYLLEMEDY